MLPDFFVIGAQKAGSTYLLECLREHPQIFMPPAEISFFEFENFRDDRIGEFARHFDGARKEQVVGVKRANILGHPECAARLKRHMPELRIVAVLRHPLQRTISGYFHYMASGFIPIAPAEKGLTRLLEGEYTAYPRAAEIIEFGKYYQHLLAFEREFSRERMHVVLLDDIKLDPRAELEKLYRFVGVDPAFQPTSVSRRPMGATYSLSRLRLREPLDRLCREPSANGKAQIYRRAWWATSLRGLNKLVDRLVWAPLFKSGPPKLSPALTQRLMDQFRPDVEGLESWLGRPLPSWKDVPRSKHDALAERQG
jgi:hypothetical protein